MQFVWIGVGGAIGSLLRYGVGLLVADSRFPWGTMAVNMVGSFAIGFVFTFSATRWPTTLTVPVTVGLIGGFTTFSTFAWESLTMAQGGEPGRAVMYVVGSVIGGVVAALLGQLVARSMG